MKFLVITEPTFLSKILILKIAETFKVAHSRWYDSSKLLFSWTFVKRLSCRFKWGLTRFQFYQHISNYWCRYHWFCVGLFLCYFELLKGVFLSSSFRIFMYFEKPFPTSIRKVEISNFFSKIIKRTSGKNVPGYINSNETLILFILAVVI